MKKLELKHLAPYLPYGLKVMLTESSKTAEILVLNRVPFRGQIQIQTIYGTHGDMYFKPIFRPLSDLTKEQFSYLHTLLRVHLGKNKRDKMIKEGYGITDLPYFIIEQLFENHFDIFGLIEQGLAIDINTLNKEL